jgi:hypothetical protein
MTAFRDLSQLYLENELQRLGQGKSTRYLRQEA